MRLKSLTLYSEKDGKQIRDVRFREKGVSLILDSDSKEGKSGNDVGKSTFVKIIDLCLGANNTSIIYKDRETGEDENVKSFLNARKVRAILSITEENGAIHTLERGLYDKGSLAIDSVPITKLDDFRTRLRELLFRGVQDIRLRRLVPFFVRLEASEGKMFKYLDAFASDIEYREYYDCLFGVNKGRNRYRIKKSIQMKEKENREILKSEKVKTIEELADGIEKKKEELSALSKDVKSDKAVSTFDGEDANARIAEEINRLAKEYEELSSAIRVFQDKAEAEKNNIREMDESALELLYQDAKTNLPSLKSDFRDFVFFHDEMAHNRIKRYQARIEELTRRKERVMRQLKEEKRRYADEFVDFRYGLNGRANVQLDTVVRQKMRIEELQNKRSRYERNAREIQELERSLCQCEAGEEESKRTGARLNSYFREITGEVMESPVSLSFPAEGFPVQLDDGNKSSGDKKAFASCFGLSLIRLYEYLGCERPRFFVQDAIENMALPTLSRLFNLADGENAQYIIPILRDRIDALNIPDDRVILELSHKEKLFRF